METQVEFPKFIQKLKDSGINAQGPEFLQNLRASWDALSPEARLAFLGQVGLEATSLDGVEVQLGRRAGAPKTIDNVLVIIRVPRAEEESGAEAAVSGLEPPRIEEAPPDTAATPEALEPELPVPGEAAPGEQEQAEAVQEKKKGLFGRFRKQEEEEAEEEAPPKPVTEIPPVRDPLIDTVEVYPVLEPYAFVRILYDRGRHEYIYQAIEPRLTDREKNILDFIEDTLIDVVEIGPADLSEEEAVEFIRKHVDEVIFDYSITVDPVSKEKLLYYILRDFLGFGLLDPAMRDDMIEDVSCDGPTIPVFMYHRKYESVRSTIVWPTHDSLDSYVIRMAQRSGKHISIAEPLLDATLPDGSRLNATLGEEVTSKGSTFTIRKFREDPFTITDLVRFGTMSPEIAAYWWMSVQNGASAIYAGGTASGKTTGLNAIMLFIPQSMKIVSIEDTREVNLPHPNWIAGVTRAGFGPRDERGRQQGEIDMFTLLKAALRQRPEYILVGEVRGEEAYALFQAMATGHTAYGTMHADSVESVIHRLESEPINIPRSLLESLDIVSIQIQTRIGEKRVRRSKEIVEIVGLDPHTREILTNEVYAWNPTRDEFEYSGVSYVLERIQLERNMSDTDMHEELNRRRRIIQWMVDKKIRDLDDVGHIIAKYYKEPDEIVKLVDENADLPKWERRPLVPDTEGTGPEAALVIPTSEGEPDDLLASDEDVAHAEEHGDDDAGHADDDAQGDEQQQGETA